MNNLKVDLVLKYKAMQKTKIKLIKKKLLKIFMIILLMKEMIN